ncbi:hypothetical protein Bbelb_221780 [Branchiostoma belcheri]|nr:hypothetical protein Bbelb_221780 [Branchiostoma belcheri]
MAATTPSKPARRQNVLRLRRIPIFHSFQKSAAHLECDLNKTGTTCCVLQKISMDHFFIVIITTAATTNCTVEVIRTQQLTWSVMGIKQGPPAPVCLAEAVPGGRVSELRTMMPFPGGRRGLLIGGADPLVWSFSPLRKRFSPFWSLTTTQRRKIERIQRRATKIILGHYLPYDQSCKTLNLQTLHDRRETLCHQFGKTLSKSDTYNQWLPQQRGKLTVNLITLLQQLASLHTKFESSSVQQGGSLQSRKGIKFKVSPVLRRRLPDGHKDDRPPSRSSQGSPLSCASGQIQTYSQVLLPAYCRLFICICMIDMPEDGMPEFVITDQQPWSTNASSALECACTVNMLSRDSAQERTTNNHDHKYMKPIINTSKTVVQNPTAPNIRPIFTASSESACVINMPDEDGTCARSILKQHSSHTQLFSLKINSLLHIRPLLLVTHGPHTPSHNHTASTCTSTFIDKSMQDVSFRSGVPLHLLNHGFPAVVPRRNWSSESREGEGRNWGEILLTGNLYRESERATPV